MSSGAIPKEVSKLGAETRVPVFVLGGSLKQGDTHIW